MSEVEPSEEPLVAPDLPEREHWRDCLSRAPAELDRSGDEFAAFGEAVSRGDDVLAGRWAAEMMLAGCLDPRILPYFFVAQVAEHGPQQAGVCLTELCELVLEHAEALPLDLAKVKKVQRVFKPFFDRTLDLLKAHSTRDSELWRTWVAAFEIEQLEASVAEVEASEARLRAAETYLDEDFSKWSQLAELIRGFARRKRQDDDEDAAAEAAEAEAVRVAEAAAEQEESGARVNTVADEGSAMSFPMSPALKALFAKVEAFERLLQTNDMMRTAIVAQDINEIFTNFDPAVYFPTIVANYYATMSERGDELAEGFHDEGSFAGMMLRRHYLADLEGFVQAAEEGR